MGWEDPLEEDMATRSNILPWRIPMDREAWQATVHGLQRVRHDLHFPVVKTLAFTESPKQDKPKEEHSKTYRNQTDKS